MFSGGLDSLLSVALIRDQGILVEGVTFETPFFASEKARRMAQRMDLPLRVFDITEAHLAMLRAPRYGYGRWMNPCIDCHALMLRKTGEWMEKSGADFLFTGEVLGQRPMSQGKQMLHVVAKNAGYAPVILRPLSALLLPETQPEREGKVDRQRLLDIQGRGRKRQIALARHYGIAGYPPPAGGCLLTDPMFSRRLRDLFDRGEDTVRAIELLKVGRHFRLPSGHKVIVGRQSADNHALASLAGEGDALLRVADVPGPTVLIPGPDPAEALYAAAGLCVRYSDAPKDRPVRVICLQGGGQTVFSAAALSPEEAAVLLL